MLEIARAVFLLNPLNPPGASQRVFAPLLFFPTPEEGTFTRRDGDNALKAAVFCREHHVQARGEAQEAGRGQDC